MGQGFGPDRKNAAALKFLSRPLEGSGSVISFSGRE
jgi:hypothetical protein